MTPRICPSTGAPCTEGCFADSSDDELVNLLLLLPLEEGRAAIIVLLAAEGCHDEPADTEPDAHQSEFHEPHFPSRFGHAQPSTAELYAAMREPLGRRVGRGMVKASSILADDAPLTYQPPGHPFRGVSGGRTPNGKMQRLRAKGRVRGKRARKEPVTRIHAS